MDYSEILSNITIDHFSFKVTWSPINQNACVLWFLDSRISTCFEAMGQFTNFDMRNILFFISRYVTNSALRTEIDSRRFARLVEGLPMTFFRDIEKLSLRDKERAYRNLFNLDSEIEPENLAARRRVMARKFHPDVGGDTQTMTLINEAYDFLVQTSAS